MRLLTMLAVCAFATGTATAGEMSKIKAEIVVNPAAMTDSARAGAELQSIERQAREACRFEAESVLSEQYDKACAADLVRQAVNQLNHTELSRVYVMQQEALPHVGG